MWELRKGWLTSELGRAIEAKKKRRLLPALLGSIGRLVDYRTLNDHESVVSSVTESTVPSMSVWVATKSPWTP